MKIQTFKKGDDKAVNDFVADNTVIGFNILQDGDIMVQYNNDVFTAKDEKEYYMKELSDNLRQQAALGLDLAYEEGIEPDEETGVRKRGVQEKIDKLKVESKILEAKLA